MDLVISSPPLDVSRFSKPLQDYQGQAGATLYSFKDYRRFRLLAELVGWCISVQRLE